MSNKTLITNLLAFYTMCEKLKTTIRHSYTTDPNRLESSAEHSWLMALMAMTLFEHLSGTYDQARVLKMIIIHDLAEAIVGDIPAFEISERKTNKKALELEAFTQLIKDLPSSTRDEFLLLWHEYEDKETIEAKIVQAIDKMEAPLQHNLADINLWDQGDYDIHPFYKIEFAAFDPFLQQLRAEVEAMSYNKITNAGQTHRLKKEHQKEYEQFGKQLKKK